MKLYAEKLREGQNNQYIFKTRTHNLETLASIHKKSARLLETSLLKNCGKFGGEGHVSETKQRPTTIMKEGYTG